MGTKVRTCPQVLSASMAFRARDQIGLWNFPELAFAVSSTTAMTPTAELGTRSAVLSCHPVLITIRTEPINFIPFRHKEFSIHKFDTVENGYQARELHHHIQNKTGGLCVEFGYCASFF